MSTSQPTTPPPEQPPPEQGKSWSIPSVSKGVFGFKKNILGREEDGSTIFSRHFGNSTPTQQQQQQQQAAQGVIDQNQQGAVNTAVNREEGPVTDPNATPVAAPVTETPVEVPPTPITVQGTLGTLTPDQKTAIIKECIEGSPLTGASSVREIMEAEVIYINEKIGKKVNANEPWMVPELDTMEIVGIRLDSKSIVYKSPSKGVWTFERNTWSTQNTIAAKEQGQNASVLVQGQYIKNYVWDPIGLQDAAKVTGQVLSNVGQGVANVGQAMQGGKRKTKKAQKKQGKRKTCKGGKKNKSKKKTCSGGKKNKSKKQKCNGGKKSQRKQKK